VRGGEGALAAACQKVMTKLWENFLFFLDLRRSQVDIWLTCDHSLQAGVMVSPICGRRKSKKL